MTSRDDQGSMFMAMALPKLWPTFASGRRIGNYTRVKWPWPVAVLCYLVLIAFAVVYGFTFGVLNGFSVVMFVGPLLVLGMLAIWAMPDLRYVPVRTMAWLLAAFLYARLIWPDYIALAIGNLPWITAVRLTGVPLFLLLILAYIGSSAFRAQLRDILRPTREITWLMLALVAVATLTIVMSSHIGYALQQYFIFWYAGIGLFFVSAFYFNKPGRVRKFSVILLVATVLSIAIAAYETKYSHLPWVGHIPSFLAIEDPRITTLLAGSARAATGIYRVQSKFSTSIGLGEFFGLAIPFLLHLLFVTRRIWLKVFLIVLLPSAMIIVQKTDSRLAFVCYVSSFLLYALFRVLVLWRSRPNNIFAPAMALAYPVFMLFFLAATFAWHSLSIKVWGGGAAQASTQSRKDQWNLAIPKIERNPIGHGIGESGGVLNYIAPGFDMPTVDSYFITILLDFGVLGFLVYYGMFGVAIFRSGAVALKSRDEDVQFLAAACIALTNFVLGKSVYSQTENHPLAFIILGMVVALIRRYKADAGELPPPPIEEDLIRPQAVGLTYRDGSR